MEILFLHKIKRGVVLMVKKQVFPETKALGTILIALLAVFCLFPMTAFAESGRTEVIGTLYEFDKNSDYDLQESSSSSNTNTNDTYGTFYLNGNISSVGEKSGVPAYEVSDGNLDVFYNYGDTLLNADEDSWHLVEDKGKKVDGLELDSDILKGAIVVQTSADRRNWVNAETMCNAFSDVPIRSSSIYTTTDVQLLNGCYYRVIVAYELRIRTEDSNFLFINTDKHKYKKFAEVYEFYAYTNGGENGTADFSQTYSLGERVRAENFDGYYGEGVINKDDIHYGWELGNFFVSGYTDEVTDSEGNIVFLKNVGDKVTLWFNLNENINRLNGKDNLSITADSEGYDQYFETPRMNFGRGTLIIRYTDYNNVKAEPTIYTNYLEANVTVGANTKVQLFEEGDYEVALDYCGWPLDVHHPRGLYSGAEGPYYSNARVPVTEIPFRCLYSKNIENLMMAGRCMSVSHLALGTVRVQNTLATLGQAAGTAAARCIREKITPRGIYETQMADFQQELLRDDLYIPSIVNEDPRDLAKSARITSTSVSRTERYNLHRGVENGFLPLDGTLAMSRSLPQKAQYVRVMLRNEKEVPVPVRASLLAMKSAGDYEGAAVHDRAEAVVPARFEGWFDLPLDCNVGSPAIGVALEPAEGLSWQSLACTCFEKWSGRRLNAYRWEADSKRSFAAEFFPEELPLADCSPESVARGASRIVSETEYGWVSDPSEPLPQAITLSWDGEQELHQVQLIFDTDLINPAYSYVTLPIVKRTVSDYRVEVSTADGWKTVAEVTDNFLRRNTLSFPAVQSDALRVTVLKTCGDPSARIFEIRVY